MNIGNFQIFIYSKPAPHPPNETDRKHFWALFSVINFPKSMGALLVGRNYVSKHYACFFSFFTVISLYPAGRVYLLCFMCFSTKDLPGNIYFV